MSGPTQPESQRARKALRLRLLPADRALLEELAAGSTLSDYVTRLIRVAAGVDPGPRSTRPDPAPRRPMPVAQAAREGGPSQSR